MALEYKLALQEPAEPSEATARLVATPDFVRNADGIEAPDLIVSVRSPSALTVEVIEDEFGFKPRVQVYFRLRNKEEPDAARLMIVRACAALLALSGGDAVLLFNGEHVVLLRKQGRLLLNSDGYLGFWSAERRALLGLPHELESIPHI